MNDMLIKGYLYLTPGDYPVLKMTDMGRNLISGESGEAIILKLPKETERTPAARKKKKAPVTNAKYPELFEVFRKRRYEMAQKNHVPPYIIFSDKTLKEMSTNLPSTKEAMLGVNGVGAKKYEKYGKEFMNLIQEYKVNEGV